MAAAFVPIKPLVQARPPTPASSSSSPRRTIAATARRSQSVNDLGYEISRFNSAWRDNVFCGGFPGGEEHFAKWVEAGMKDDVPGLQSAFQPSNTSPPATEERPEGAPKNLGYEMVRDNSAWRDNAFCGGFPGGEVFLMKWIEGGMKEDLPELQPGFQPSSGVRKSEQTEEVFCHPLLGYCWETRWSDAAGSTA